MVANCEAMKSTHIKEGMGKIMRSNGEPEERGMNREQPGEGGDEGNDVAKHRLTLRKLRGMGD